MDSTRTPSLWRRLLACIAWESLLIWPSFLVFVYAGFFVRSRLILKGPNEELAPVVLALAFLIFLARWLRERLPLTLILTVLTAALFCRELHFKGTTDGIYVALFLIGVWSMLWWRHIATDLRESDTTSILLFALMTYALSQAVARRAFRGILPLEAESDLFRTGLEETLENLAHLSMLLVAILGFSREDEEDSDENVALPETASPVDGTQTSGAANVVEPTPDRASN